MFFEWQGNQPVTLRCIDKYFETHDTVSIKLAELTESLLFQFKPGQFINLGVEIDGKMEFRLRLRWLLWMSRVGKVLRVASN